MRYVFKGICAVKLWLKGCKNMSKNIFIDPIDEISYNDIESFCKNKISENVRVDYKEDFPNNLAKCIIGFANKYGGILFIGIKANKTTNIPTSIVGVNLEEGLEEKVINISHANINPPITPEVSVCTFKSGSGLTEDDKAVILVRVDESYETPHMFIKNQNNRIYERIHNETRPADLRTTRELFEKSEKSEVKLNKIINDKIIKIRHDGFRTVYVIPAYPVKNIIKFNIEIDNFLRNSTSSHLHFGDYRPLRDGAIFEHKSGSKAEITEKGLISYKESWKTEDSQGTGNGDISIDRTMSNVVRTLQYSLKIYKKVGYFGSVLIGIDLDGTKNKFLFTEPKRRLDERFNTTERTVSINQKFSYNDFEDILKPTLSIFEMLFRSFGLVIEEKTLAEWIETYTKFRW